MEDAIEVWEMEQFIFFTYYVCIYHPDMQGRGREMAAYRVGLTFFKTDLYSSHVLVTIRLKLNSADMFF